MKVSTLAQDITDYENMINCYFAIKNTPGQIDLRIVMPVEKMRNIAYERRRKKQQN